VDAKNGAHSSIGTINQTDLYWDIISGNDIGYFSIDNSNGTIGLINPSIPLGVYDLTIRVRDAVIPPAPGTPLTGTGVFQTLFSTIIVRITVGPKPAPNHLQYFDGGAVWMPYSTTSCDVVPGQGYGAVHVGVDDLSLDVVTHINNNLPDLTATTFPFPPFASPTSKAFQNYTNVQIANGATGPTGPDPATGLTQGALEWEVIGEGVGSETEGRSGSTYFILYYRPLTTAPNTNPWQPVLDENGVLFPASTIWGAGINPWLDIRITLPYGGSSSSEYARRSVKFITATPGEYCLVIKSTYAVIHADVPSICGPQFDSRVIIKDANYDYLSGNFDPPVLPSEPVHTSPFPPPSITPIEYNVGIKQEYDIDNYPSGVPYDTQDATVGFSFSTTTKLFSPTPAGPAIASNQIQVESIPAQLVPGLYVGLTSPVYFTTITQITDIDYATNTITLSNQALLDIPTGTTIPFNTLTARLGSVWAATNNGLHVDQFYIDSDLTIVWNPPIADKFYVYQNKNLDYTTGVPISGMEPPTNKPYFCAKFNEHGGVMPLLSPDSTVKTAWKFNLYPNLENYGRNIFQYTNNV
jgi:hypothetical protein